MDSPVSESRPGAPRFVAEAGPCSHELGMDPAVREHLPFREAIPVVPCQVRRGQDAVESISSGGLR